MRMSIGQALGIVTAGDRRRAAERAGRRAGMKKGMEKGMEKGMAQERSRNEAVNAKRVEFLRSQNVCLILKKVDTVQKGRYSANGDKTGRKNRPGP